MKTKILPSWACSLALISVATACAAGTKWNRHHFSFPREIGDYDVSFTLGGENAQRAWIRFEGRRLALGEIATKAGETTNVTFTARVKGPIARGDGPQREAPFPKTLDLTVVTDGPRPPSPVVAPRADAHVVYLCGDSTVTDQQAEPWGSWGQTLPRAFKPGVAVANFARSGLTTTSFRRQGRLERLCAHAKAGDVVLIQFGHNDQKSRWLSPEAGGGYEKELHGYLDAIEKTSAAAVLVTPVERVRFTKGKQDAPTLTAYADAMKRVGAARKVPVIDLNDASYRVYGALGEQGSRGLFVGKDRTHHNIHGAAVMSRFIANELVRVRPELKPFLREESRLFDPANPPPESFVPPCGVVDETRPEGDVGNKH